MALFTDLDFTTNTVDVPVGQSTITDNGVVSLTKSDGVTQTVFSSLTVALKALNFMNSRSQYYMMAGDDITIVNLQTKLLIVENTFVNQKLLNSYVFSYHGKGVRGVHRNMSTMFNLTDSLMSVGFKVNSSTIWNTNVDLETASTNIKICDWFYHVGSGTQLEDQTQIVFQ